MLGGLFEENDGRVIKNILSWGIFQVKFKWFFGGTLEEFPQWSFEKKNGPNYWRIVCENPLIKSCKIFRAIY